MGRVAIEAHFVRSFSGLSDLAPAHFPLALERISEVVSQALDVSDVLLSFGVRDRSPEGPLRGWRSIDARRYGPNAEADEAVLAQWYRTARRQAADPAVRRLIGTHGAPRAFLRAQTASEESWRQTEIDTLHGDSGIGDRVVGASPLSSGVELLIVAYRRRHQVKFGCAERDRLEALAAALIDPGRVVARAHGFIDAAKPLAPREREALRLLLLGLSESRAAAWLGLTTRSFHQYVVAIYRSLGVRSRAELAAHFSSARQRRRAISRWGSQLAVRERLVLEGLLEGRAEKQIAAALNVSHRAVHHVVASIYDKLGVRDRPSLCALVLSAGARGEPERKSAAE